MATFQVPGVPGELHWQNQPASWQARPDGSLVIQSGEKSDWFSSPAGTHVNANAPSALFTPPDPAFFLSARVEVDFDSNFDAGVLRIHENDQLWAKLCFEFSPQRQPMVVSVVTRGLSDDCNSVDIQGRVVYLRMAVTPQAIAFHYSLDGDYWHFVRYFSLGKLSALQVGFSAQSPTGPGCRAVFSEIRYRAGVLKNTRNGE